MKIVNTKPLFTWSRFLCTFSAARFILFEQFFLGDHSQKLIVEKLNKNNNFKEEKTSQDLILL